MDFMNRAMRWIVGGGVAFLMTACVVDPPQSQSFSLPTAQAIPAPAAYQFSGTAVFADQHPVGGFYVYVSFYEDRMAVSGVFVEPIPLQPKSTEALYFSPNRQTFDLVFSTDVSVDHYIDSASRSLQVRCSTNERQSETLTPCSSKFAQAEAGDEAGDAAAVYRYDEQRITAQLDLILDRNALAQIAEAKRYLADPESIDALRKSASSMTVAGTGTETSKPTGLANQLRLSQDISGIPSGHAPEAVSQLSTKDWVPKSEDIQPSR